jgi:HTH-type transcriptional regulator / antitoxin HigA
MATSKKHPYEPDHAVAPGETLLETIEALGMSQADLAIRTGHSEKHISQVINGHAPITPQTALEFERVVGVPARFWLSAEARYQELKAKLEARARLQAEIARLPEFPYAEIARHAYLPRTRDSAEKVENLYRFFQINDFDALRRLYQPAFRIARSRKPNNAALAAWLRMGEIDAREVPTEPFDARGLAKALPKLRALTLADAQEYGSLARSLCARHGIALVLVPHLAGTYAHGATRWLAPDRVLVQLSLRGAWADVFWFSLFHELGHVLKHSKRSIFVRGDDFELTAQEHEANAFAADALVAPADFQRLATLPGYTRDTVARFAAEVGVAPGVVVGRLQHEGLLSRAQLNDLRVRLTWA